MKSVNPATGSVIREYKGHTASETEKIISASHTVFLHWRTTEFAERSRLMRQLASVLRQEQERFALLMTEEMGKPIREARAEVEKCAWVAEYYAGHAPSLLADEPVTTEASHSFVTYQPLGLV